LIGFVLFILLYFPIIYYVPAYRVQKLLEVQVVVATVTLFGIMGYAVSANGGSAGNLIKPAIALSKTEAAFKIVQGITSVAGTYTGGTDRVSDWTRYGKSRHTSTPAIIALAFTVTLAALLGIIATSAFAEAYGELQWNPMIMVSGHLTRLHRRTCGNDLSSFNTSKPETTHLLAGLGLSSLALACSASQSSSITPRTVCRQAWTWLCWHHGSSRSEEVPSYSAY
jgi:cytosine/uracil/thiamine/allantoin permease